MNLQSLTKQQLIDRIMKQVRASQEMSPEDVRRALAGVLALVQLPRVSQPTLLHMRGGDTLYTDNGYTETLICVDTAGIAGIVIYFVKSVPGCNAGEIAVRS